MNYKRILAIFLTVVMLLSASSCGIIIVNDISGEKTPESGAESGQNDSPQNSQATEFEKYQPEQDGLALSKEYLASLPERDYEDAVFFITTPARDYIAPEDAGDSVSKLAIRRNEMVEEHLNIRLKTSVVNGDTMYQQLKDAEAAGTYYTDLLMVPIYMIGKFKMDDLLLNMRTVPFFDLDQPYFNAASSDMTSGGYTTYGVAGEASISPGSFSAIYMNKNLLASAGVDPKSLYDAVLEGTWTWDEYFTCTAAIADLNENTSQSIHTTAVQSAASRFPDLVFLASGNDYVRTGVRFVPKIDFTVTGVQKTMETLARLYQDENALIGDSLDGSRLFGEGEAAFLVDYLSALPVMSNTKAEWGLLPLPKEEVTDEYRTLIANTEQVFAIPAGHTNSEYAAITLAALNAASCGYLYDEYVNYNMLHTLRDNASVEMLDVILDTADFDFALAFGNAYPEIANGTYKLIRQCAPYNNLSDVFEGLKEQANQVMKDHFNLRY